MAADWWTDKRQRRRGGAGPWGWGRFFGAGEVRLALLSLLDEQPKHGYQLMKELEERSGGLYRSSAGTIYPTLQQLEDEGLVASEPVDGKRIYRLTDAGRAELAREAERVKRIWRRADNWDDWTGWLRPETAMLAGPLSRLAKAAVRAVSRADGPDTLARVQEVLDRARAELDRDSASPKPTAAEPSPSDQPQP